ncbi:MAG: tellurite resistance/C4-dicarboxylate transporter family protein [Verrucomicrobia bacterium]|nr:tellurite resistance/C4-dicarboxylate transporter family protein [Verrucomicrobiota bacterium]
MKKKFDPVSFGYVMATGIISIAFKRLEWPSLSILFLLLALIGYVILNVRACWSFSILMNTVLDPQALFKWFTFSAGTNTLATRLTMEGWYQSGYWLAVLGSVSACIFLYWNFFRLFQTVESIQSISPLWLLKAIACNSVGIAITTLWACGEISHPLYLVIAVGFWTFGFFIYLLLMSLNMYRMFFLPFEGSDISPAYWTCMGAAAISVFDASNIVTLQNVPEFLTSIRHFLQGMILILWLWGTAWLPILCFMGFWKYISFKMPFVYEPSLWAMVFPLGMYTVASHALPASILLPVAPAFVDTFLGLSIATWLMSASLLLFKQEKEKDTM